MIDADLRLRANRLARGLLSRDWPADPTYIVFASDLDTDPGRTIRGAFSDRSLMFCQVIGDDWAGIGRVILLNDSHMQKCQAEQAGRRSFEADLLGTLIHEAAHAVLAPLPEVSPAEQFVAELCASTGQSFPGDTVDAYAARLAEIAVDELPPLEQRQVAHGSDFHRAVVHLNYRAFHDHRELFGPSDVGYAAPMYAKADAGEFVRSLLAECQQRIDEPIRQIVASVAPEAFVELCKRENFDAA